MSDVRERRRVIIREYYAALDRGDITDALAVTSDDLKFRFGNASPQTGRDAVAVVGQKLGSIVTGVKHDIRSIQLSESALYGTAEVELTYQRPGDDLRVPACAVFGFDDDDVISECRIYLDVSALGVDTSQW